MLKNLSLNDVTDLCNGLSTGSVQNADETKESRTSFKLMCLTTCYKWFRNEEHYNLKITSGSFKRLLDLVVDLVQTDEDPFVLYATRKALVVLLDHQSCQVESKEILSGILDCLGKDDICIHNKITILEVVSDLLQREFAISVLDALKQRFIWLVENLLRFPLTNKDCILPITFIILWRKSVQKCHDLQLDLCWLIKYDIILQILHEINVKEKLIYSRQVIHLMKTFYCYGQCLCLKTSVNHVYLKLGKTILHWALERGISDLHDNLASGFGGKLILGTSKAQIKAEFGNLSSLRQLAALLLSVAATIVRFSQNTEVNPALSDLCACLLQLNDHATVTVYGSDHSGQPFDWMTAVFGDQDDSLMEALLETLDIYCIAKKRLDTLGPYLEKLTTMINPHRQFHQLLQMTGFDHIVLVDLLTSPETCALLYLTRYLKCVINEWDNFLETLDILSNRKTLDNGQIMPNCDEIKTEDVLETITNTSGDNVTTGKAEGHSNMGGVSSTENQESMFSGYKSGSKQENIKSETRSETDSSSAFTVKSEGLALVGQYSSDDDDDDDDDEEEDDGLSGHKSIDKSAEIVSKMETMEIKPNSLDEGSPCMELKSDLTRESESTVAAENCENELQVNKCLDETMATMIRLRLKMESLCEGGLLLYNPGPLVRLLNQCEALYEQ